MDILDSNTVPLGVHLRPQWSLQERVLIHGPAVPAAYLEDRLAAEGVLLGVRIDETWE